MRQLPMAAIVGFAHKRGNPIPQILDPPLEVDKGLAWQCDQHWTALEGALGIYLYGH